MLTWFGETRVPLFGIAGAFGTVIFVENTDNKLSQCAFTVLHGSGGNLGHEG